MRMTITSKEIRIMAINVSIDFRKTQDNKNGDQADKRQPQRKIKPVFISNQSAVEITLESQGTLLYNAQS